MTNIKYAKLQLLFINAKHYANILQCQIKHHLDSIVYSSSLGVLFDWTVGNHQSDLF